LCRVVLRAPGVAGDGCACQEYWASVSEEGEACGACSCPTVDVEGADPVCAVTDTGCAGADGAGQCVCCSDTCNFFHTSVLDGCDCSCACCSGGGIALIVVFSLVGLAGLIGILWVVFVYPRRGCCWPWAPKPAAMPEMSGEDEDLPEDAGGADEAELAVFEEDAVQEALALSAREDEEGAAGRGRGRDS